MRHMGLRHVWLWSSKLGKAPGWRTQGPAGLPPSGCEGAGRQKWAEDLYLLAAP